MQSRMSILKLSLKQVQYKDSHTRLSPDAEKDTSSLFDQPSSPSWVDAVIACGTFYHEYQLQYLLLSRAGHWQPTLQAVA